MTWRDRGRKAYGDLVATTLTPRRAAARSTVALKVTMAASGLIMVLYLLAHMYGNLKVFNGKESFDSYAHHLRTIGEPMLPHEGLLWIIRVVLLVAVVAHVYSAATLWRRARAATLTAGKRYHTTQNRRGMQRSYSSFTMRWGGIIILLFIVYHLLHLTANVIHPGGASDSPYERVVDGFQIWWVTLSYVIALIAVGFHLRHGIWSALATLGANTSDARRTQLNVLATVLSLVIVIGFLAPPVSILFGWVG